MTPRKLRTLIRLRCARFQFEAASFELAAAKAELDDAERAHRIAETDGPAASAELGLLGTTSRTGPHGLEVAVYDHAQWSRVQLPADASHGSGALVEVARFFAELWGRSAGADRPIAWRLATGRTVVEGRSVLQLDPWEWIAPVDAVVRPSELK